MAVKTEIKQYRDYISAHSAAINAMRRFIKRDSKDPEVQKYARAVIAITTPVTMDGWIQTIQCFVTEAFNYLDDPPDVEMIQDIRATNERRGGDCDDFVVLTNTLFEALGFKTNIVTVGDTPGQWEHTFSSIKVYDQWRDFDPVQIMLNSDKSPDQWRYREEHVS